MKFALMLNKDKYKGSDTRVTMEYLNFIYDGSIKKPKKSKAITNLRCLN
jgi:hypothetical protein